MSLVLPSEIVEREKTEKNPTVAHWRRIADLQKLRMQRKRVLRRSSSALVKKVFFTKKK